MSRFIALFIIFVATLLNGAPPVFSTTQEFKLKKEERAYAIFDDGSGVRDIFEFSWTLYDHTNLIVLTKLRGYPKQFVLSRRRGLELLRQEILPASRLEKQDGVELFLEFSGYERGTATLTLTVRDIANKMSLELYPNSGSYTPPPADMPPNSPLQEP